MFTFKCWGKNKRCHLSSFMCGSRAHSSTQVIQFNHIHISWNHYSESTNETNICAVQNEWIGLGEMENDMSACEGEIVKKAHTPSHTFACRNISLKFHKVNWLENAHNGLDFNDIDSCDGIHFNWHLGGSFNVRLVELALILLLLLYTCSDPRFIVCQLFLPAAVAPNFILVIFFSTRNFNDWCSSRFLPNTS